MKVSVQTLLDAGIYEQYHSVTLASYYGPEEIRKTVSSYMGLLKKGKCRVGLYLVGGNYCGKMLLAMSVAKYALLRIGTTVKCVTLDTIVTGYTGTWAVNSDDMDYEHTILNVGLLVITELDRPSVSEMIRGAVRELFEHRYRRWLPTIVVTTLPLTGELSLMSKYDSNLTSTIQKSSLIVECPKVSQAERETYRNLQKVLR